MKKFPLHQSLYLLILTFICITACNGQEKAEPPKSAITQSKQSASDQDEFDPYYAPTEGIRSPYGPKSITRNMMLDKEGNVWLATWEGLLRYDGKEFVNITNKEGLREFRYFAIIKDSKENIWLGTIGAGIYRYDGQSFINFTTKDGLPSDRVTNLYEDTKGNIWIGTEGGASKYDGKTFTNFTTEEGLPHNDINTIVEDNNGKFWIGTRGEACYYDGKTFTKIETENGQSFFNVRSIIKDTKGAIWLGGSSGLWRYHNGAFSIAETAFVGYIYEDSKGHIWTSSQSLDDRQEWIISRYDPSYLLFQLPSATQILKQQGMFFGILEDKKGNIWFGKLDGVGRYDGEGFNYFREK